jgi:hypothetical protein
MIGCNLLNSGFDNKTPMLISKVWLFLSTPPGAYEPNWRLTRRWVLRVLSSYAVAALSGALLLVVGAGLLALVKQ